MAARGLGKSFWLDLPNRLLRHPWMTGIGAIGTVVTVGIMLWPSDEPVANNSTTVVASTIGNCAAVGQDAQTQCVFPPRAKQIGDVEVSQVSGTSYVFDGAPDSLPSPPDFPVERRSSHCEEWSDWLSLTPGIYNATPDFHLGMVSGPSDQVTLTAVTATVFDRKPLQMPHTPFWCAQGSNAIEGSDIYVDVATGKTTLEAMRFTDSGAKMSPPMAMPPAALELSGAGFESALLHIESNPRYLYSGQLQVSALVNGDERIISIGSPERPFRWVDGTSVFTGESYGWNPDLGAWQPGYNPFVE